MSGVLRMGWLFWLFVLFAAGFARYFVLALLDDDRQLAIAADRGYPAPLLVGGGSV